MKIESEVKLPQRARDPYLATLQTVHLTTNCFKISFKACQLSCYWLEFRPRIEDDDRQRRLDLILANKKKIEERIGPNFSINGQTVLAVDGPQEEIVVGISEGRSLVLRYSKQVRLQDRSTATRQFVSGIFKGFMRAEGLTEIGRESKFMASAITKTNYDFRLRFGFGTNVSFLEAGLYLRIDCINKIESEVSVLDFVNDFYVKHKSFAKDEKRALLEDSLRGKTIVTTYGNHKYYRIEGLVFDCNPKEYNLDGKDGYTLVSYYKNKYGIDIKNFNAPLLKVIVSRSKNKAQNPALLFPELCKMTGLPQNCDEKIRRQISNYTIKPPEQKFQRTRQLMSKLANQKPGLRAMQKVGLIFDEKMAEVQGKRIQMPCLQLGNKMRVDQGRVSFFQLFDKPLYEGRRSVRIVAFHTAQNTNEVMQMKRVMLSTSSNFSVRTEVETVRVSDDYRGYLQQLLGRLSNLTEGEVGLVVLPNNFKDNYKKIKQYCLQGAKFLLSQVMLASTLRSKNFQSIVTKILLQINAKVGNVLWSPKLLPNVKETMLVGISSNKDAQAKGRTAVGLCATTDARFGKYYSVLCYQQGSDVVVTQLKDSFLKLMMKYNEANPGALPSQILVLRQGVSEGAVLNVAEIEVQALKEALLCVQNYKPRLCFMVVDKRPGMKFVTGRDANPPAGTIVHDAVVGSPLDFYMLPQEVRRGTATPVFYRVVYSDSALLKSQIAETVFGQCFNYANWSGSVRVPGVLQYARKLSQFASLYLHKEVREDCGGHLFYI